MTVIFTINSKEIGNEDTLFVGCYSDMESCKQAILKDVNEYIKANNFSEDEIEDNESYYTVFNASTREREKFFVSDFTTKTSIEVTEL